MATKIVVMKDGVIQQIDSPRELYENPGNLFVAGFIGTPKMNFMDAELKGDGEEYSLNVSGFKLPLPAGIVKKETIVRYAGKAVILGIRPEHMYLDSGYSMAAGGYKIETHIEVAELMGAETYLHFTLGDNSNIVARVPSVSELSTGDKVSLFINLDKMYLFDKETHKRI